MSLSGVPKDLIHAVSKTLGTQCVSFFSVSGGDIAFAERVELSSGEKVFLKWGKKAPKGLFQAEADGLARLRAPQVMPVPEVLGLGEAEGGLSYLILEYLSPGERDEAEFGRCLAQLHDVRGEACGLERDNFIGRLRQINTPATSTDWGTFFFEKRLFAQALLGQKNGWCKENFFSQLEKKRELIVDSLNEFGEPPSLLHGDLWSGNVFWSANGPALIDPAVYYGHREADIAFLELFGSPGSSFYQRYEQHLPLAKGFSRRKEILNLYHLMTHSNLFGGSYIHSAQNVLRAI